MAGVFVVGHKRAGMAGFDVHKTGRPTNYDDLEIQGGKSGRIMGRQVGIDKR